MSEADGRKRIEKMNTEDRLFLEGDENARLENPFLFLVHFVRATE